jgi:hypothetical protein
VSRAAFLLSKDPTTAHGGDVTMTRLLMSLVAEDHEVVAICLSPDAVASEPELVRVRKEPVRPLPTVWDSLRRGQSLVHARFDSDAFRDAIDELDADLYIAEHTYMAEPFLRSCRAGGPAPLFVNTHVSESLVWAQTRGRLVRFEGGRIRRDEVRVARAAHAVGTFDLDEAADYRAAGVRRAQWLELTSPPQAAVDVAGSGPQLVFLGDRTWRPNAVAADLVREWWPDISAGIADAELVVVGKSAAGERPVSRPGITELGFVEDLDGLLASCRALVAPIRTGGGVRVKILDAASRGLPVVATSAGIGSLDGPLGLTPYDERDELIARCRALLADAELAAAEGKRLHDANATHWAERRPQRSVTDWLAS